MKIYISGRFEDQYRLRPYRDRLWGMGHEVVSSWLDEVAQPPVMDWATFQRKIGIKDLGEVRAADLLILDVLGLPSSGKNIEFGAALASLTPKLLYVVGPPTSTFHFLADRIYPTWEECLDAIYSSRETGDTRPAHAAPQPSH